MPAIIDDKAWAVYTNQQDHPKPEFKKFWKAFKLAIPNALLTDAEVVWDMCLVDQFDLVNRDVESDSLSYNLAHHGMQKAEMTAFLMRMPSQVGFKWLGGRAEKIGVFSATLERVLSTPNRVSIETDPILVVSQHQEATWNFALKFTPGESLNQSRRTSLIETNRKSSPSSMRHFADSPDGDFDTN